MNKILIGLNVLLVAAVAFLFYKVNSLSSDTDVSVKQDNTIEPIKKDKDIIKVSSINSVSTPVTGKIAFVNIDQINEQSTEVNDLVAEAKRSKTNIEASVESLSIKYQTKMEEYQASAKAGIRSQADMEALAKEIQTIEREAQNKQLQMDNLSMSINEKNTAFQEGLKQFLAKWNNGRFDYILTYSNAIPSMLLGNASLDITKEVIENVNAEYKNRKSSSKIKK
ncbi:MAG: OmpH family outer membrane protein [Bacteroidetes bacterium]|nr:OmpH family outer membrane protein [Bacteroidota bacterium]